MRSTIRLAVSTPQTIRSSNRVDINHLGKQATVLAVRGRWERPRQVFREDYRPAAMPKINVFSERTTKNRAVGLDQYIFAAEELRDCWSFYKYRRRSGHDPNHSQ